MFIHIKHEHSGFPISLENRDVMFIVEHRMAQSSQKFTKLKILFPILVNTLLFLSLRLILLNRSFTENPLTLLVEKYRNSRINSIQKYFHVIHQFLWNCYSSKLPITFSGISNQASNIKIIIRVPIF